MKISTTLPSIGSPQDSGRSRPVNGSAQQAAVPAGAQVELSPLSSRLQELKAEASSSPVVDAQRVAEIRQAISEGRFKVNPERIADGLLSSVRQMLARER